VPSALSAGSSHEQGVAAVLKQIPPLATRNPGGHPSSQARRNSASVVEGRNVLSGQIKHDTHMRNDVAWMSGISFKLRKHDSFAALSTRMAFRRPQALLALTGC
jgi:hypothetical protein